MPRIVYRPRALHVRITADCNLACEHCERELLPKSKSGALRIGQKIEFDDGRQPLDLSENMKSETWNLVKEKLMPYVAHMELGGLGEPTLVPLFDQAAADILTAGKSLFFFTNGHYLGRPSLLEAVGDSPRVSISIDAGTKEGYKRIRHGDLDHFKDNVRAFRAAKPNAILCSQFTATANNIDELPAWVQLCSDLGIGKRHELGEEITMVGADHHVTSRADQSIRFLKDKTLQRIDEARAIAEKEGVWFMANPPEFSTENPNAISDGSDRLKIRRYSDFLMGANPCGGTGGGSAGATVFSGPISGGSPLGWYRLPADSPLLQAPDPTRLMAQPKDVRIVPKEMYVDCSGEVWSCLARHVIGDVRNEDWNSIVDDNVGYQLFLRNWGNGISNDNDCCNECPRLK